MKVVSLLGFDGRDVLHPMDEPNPVHVENSKAKRISP